jgi:hydrogenase 3 maturation protease
METKTMSSPSWRGTLRQTLNRLKQIKQGQPRIAVVGVGHELRGDDAAGMVLAQMLKSKVSEKQDTLVIPAGSAPENCTGLLRRFAPDLVLLIDAAHMDLEPGEIQWLEWQATTGLSASTHSLPLHMFSSYLCSELNCEVALLGIQPVALSVGADLSPCVWETVMSASNALCEIL